MRLRKSRLLILLILAVAAAAVWRVRTDETRRTLFRSPELGGVLAYSDGEPVRGFRAVAVHWFGNDPQPIASPLSTCDVFDESGRFRLPVTACPLPGFRYSSSEIQFQFFFHEEQVFAFDKAVNPAVYDAQVGSVDIGKVYIPRNRLVNAYLGCLERNVAAHRRDFGASVPLAEILAFLDTMEGAAGNSIDTDTLERLQRLRLEAQKLGK